MPTESAPLGVGGVPIRRIVILTVRMEPCASYLARRLRDLGPEIVIVSQRRLKVEMDSVAFFRRLFQRRGLRIGLDYLLLHLVKSGVRALGGAKETEGPPGVLHRDPDILGEDWLRIMEVDDINRPPDQDLLRELAPDLVLLAGAPILTKKTIGLARVACLNPHCGITPEYAGSSPFDWPIYERHFDAIGYTIHQVVPTVDGGPVLRQERVAWDPEKPNGALWPLLAARMYDALADVTRALVRGEVLEAEPQAGVRVNPPAGLFARLLAENRRRAYARRRAAKDSRA